MHVYLLQVIGLVFGPFSNVINTELKVNLSPSHYWSHGRHLYIILYGFEENHSVIYTCCSLALQYPTCMTYSACSICSLFKWRIHKFCAWSTFLPSPPTPLTSLLPLFLAFLHSSLFFPVNPPCPPCMHAIYTHTGVAPLPQLALFLCSPSLVCVNHLAYPWSGTLGLHLSPTGTSHSHCVHHFVSVTHAHSFWNTIIYIIIHYVYYM